jgi:hypothetical protein
MSDYTLNIVFADGTQKDIVFDNIQDIEDILLSLVSIIGLQRLSEDELNEFLGEKVEKIKPYLNIVNGEYEMVTSYTATYNYGNSIVSYSYKSVVEADKPYIGICLTC